MNAPVSAFAHIVLACGGTGGHLFPGLAVAERLRQHGCKVTLVVSPKEVDQQAVRQVVEMDVLMLPAVGLVSGGKMAFLNGFIRSYRGAQAAFRTAPPQAALAMGGFTSAAPLLAARRMRAQTFLHESNSIPGRANRMLSWVVSGAFVGFPSAAARCRRCPVTVTGTPVRAGFVPRNAGACRAALGLDPSRPVVLVMGGSQGASGVNESVIKLLPCLGVPASDWQWIHLAGSNDVQIVEQAYRACAARAIVRPFADEMEMLMGAATAAISRAGASSLAELAAMRLPAVLIPYPAAADEHQLHNARAFATSGAARLLEQRAATPQPLKQILCELMQDEAQRQSMQAALGRWHYPHAAEQIAGAMLEAILRQRNGNAKTAGKSAAASSSQTSTLARGSAGLSAYSA
jgi:UDP-N-acetylglucosamine--N-acetylmuramyl-(pentapeptide) pyrophosphoryl-undecaprenol N-acetylglucosamine transferase